MYTYMYVHACGCVSSYDIVGLYKIWSYHVHIPVASLAQGGLDKRSNPGAALCAVIKHWII